MTVREEFAEIVSGWTQLGSYPKKLRALNERVQEWSRTNSLIGAEIDIADRILVLLSQTTAI